MGYLKHAIGKKRVIVVLSIIALTFGHSINLSAQSKNLQKLLDNPNKMYSKAFVYSGTAPTIRKWQIKKGFASERDYVMPKRVGILAFVVSDQSNSSSVSYGYTTVRTTSKATKEGASAVANEIYDNTIETMKSTFKDKGMELLEIHDYLDDKEKTDLYHKYELKKLKGVKAFSGLTGQGNSGPVVGYRNMTLPYFGSFPKAVKKRNDFFNKLGLDAILVIEIGMSVVGNKLIDVKSDILYKNPASGTKTIYSDYNEVVSVKFGVSPYEKKPTYGGIFLIEEVEYKNKKGKTKTRKQAVGLDPNLYKLVSAVVRANVGALEKYVLGKK
ncbi:hypothetical protein H7U19_05720 [Hyunsoonleella sp. SJ7]|uniref:Uncharacterized protein n=1 Tax=Hyunsoonleella aquatilis TaxID=2762758 RepID=A0A923H888_9FLAO|nr:hypothetical protein [Hyunsoonleella aquatilis]MBC3757893.1 hypothetical protein [Hyunsoonleella aquatilis]